MCVQNVRVRPNGVILKWNAVRRDEMWDRTKQLAASPGHHLYSPRPQSQLLSPASHHSPPPSSRRSFMSHSARTPMGPPQHDTVMGPPPVPAQVAQSGSQQKAKDADFAEKYRRLKRKYFELEEVSNRPSFSRFALCFGLLFAVFALTMAADQFYALRMTWQPLAETQGDCNTTTKLR